MAELITGEAVALDIRVARLASRAVARLLDMLFQFSLLNFVLWLTSMTTLIADEAVSAGLTILMTVLIIVGYPVAFETFTRGRTLGKMALGLRVVRDDGGPVQFRQALVRSLAGFVEFWWFAGAPALICSIFNRYGKRLGDIFAGTIVIQERVPASSLLGHIAVMPPQLAGWAASMELSRVPDGLALTARQYLTRFWELMPQARDVMGQRIAGQVLALVSPPPPPGVRPEVLLSAVLAERRRREEWRLAQRRARHQQHAGVPPQGVPPGPQPYGVPPYHGAPQPYGMAPPQGPPQPYQSAPQPYQDAPQPYQDAPQPYGGPPYQGAPQHPSVP
ncbi:MAG TPA: RDD family protein [Streptosporangiaceae bacterium]